MNRKGKVMQVIAFPFLLFLCTALHAATIAVVPVRVEIDSGVRSSTITLSNEGETVTTMQADISEWTQDESGRDVYTDTDEIIAVPGIFEIPPGGKQIIRIGLLSEVTSASERAFRVFLTEIAGAGDAMQGPGVKIRLRLSVPIFVNPAEQAQPSLSLVRAERENGQLAVVLHNDGNQHVQIRSLTTKSSAYELPSDTVTPMSTYLLPGSARKFLLAVPPDQQVTKLLADTDMIGVVGYEIAMRE